MARGRGGPGGRDLTKKHGVREGPPGRGPDGKILGGCVPPPIAEKAGYPTYAPLIRLATTAGCGRGTWDPRTSPRIQRIPP